jgi:tRNA dimethylallyltransferase
MSNSQENTSWNPVVVIVGPSAVGKTSIAIQLAKCLKAEIISADSTLLYKGMNIGTAKPGEAEIQDIPHYLIDVAEPDKPWSLAEYIRAAYSIIAEIHNRRQLPIIAGGTGQYIRALLENWEIPKSAPNPQLRTALMNWLQEIGPGALFTRLQFIDPATAESIDFRNQRRIIRALEVIFQTGRRFSDQRKSNLPPYRFLVIGLKRSRQELYQRVDRRIQGMIDSGFVDEVRHFMDLGYSPKLPVFSAIGYREMFDYLKGRIDLETAIVQMKKRTRRFIRHQTNWFKPDDPKIRWFDVTDEIVEQLAVEIRQWLECNYSMQRK